MKTVRPMLLMLTVALAMPHVAAFDFAGAREEGLGRALLLSDASASALATIPTLGINAGEWKAEVAGSRRFDLSDLDEIGVSAAYARGRFALALGVAQFGQGDLYAETTMRIAAGYRWRDLGLSASFSGRTIGFGGGYDRLSATTIGLGVSYRFDRLILAAAADNLTRPRLYDGAAPYNRNLKLYAEWAGEGSYQLTGRMEFEEDEGPQFGIGQRFVLVDQAAVFVGVATDPLTWGGGIDIMHGKLRLTIAASYHPVLGLTQAFSVAFEPRRETRR